MRPSSLLALLSFLVVAVLACWLRSEATAGTAVVLDVDELVDQSGLIVEARVRVAEARLDARGRVETEYELLVERTFWGEGLTTRRVVLPGGILPDGSGMLIAGLPQLIVGERALLFLSRPSAAGLRVPIGLSQGQVRVLDAPGGSRLAVRSHSALHVVDPATGASVAPGQDVLDYAGLVAEINTAVARRLARGERPGGDS